MSVLPCNIASAHGRLACAAPLCDLARSLKRALRTVRVRFAQGSGETLGIRRQRNTRQDDTTAMTLTGAAPTQGSDAAGQDFRIAVAGLEPGMFVSRLDRPWIGTGFPLEGVLVQTVDEVERLRRLCLHVHVDARRGRAPELRYVEFGSERAKRAGGQDEFGALRRTQWAVTSDFGSEVRPARDAFARLEQDIGGAMQGLRDGGALDTQALASGIDTMIDSITRNPSALPWVLELKRKGDYVYQHALGCSVWATIFGRHLGLDREGLRDIALGALLCDVGKVRLQQPLLERAPPLREAEFHALRSHVAESVRIVADTPGLSPVVHEMVAHHHERFDGSGYPRGLRGNAIPLHARIAGLIDTYDAMTGVRPYAATRSPHEAVMLLYEERDRLFQAELVEQFIRTCGIYPTGSLVELTDGSVAVVMAVHSLKRLRPRVMVLLGADKRPLAEFRVVDLAETGSDAGGAPLAIHASLPPDAYGIDRAALFLD